MNKSIKYLLVALLSVMLFVTACTPGATSDSESPSTEPQPAELPDDSTSGDEPMGPDITIKIGYSTNEEDPRGLASAMLKELVEERTNGTVIIEIYPAGQLGGDAALIEAMALDSGTVDLIITDASNFATYEPKMGISALPFLFAGFEEAWAFMDSDIVADVEELMLDHNIRVLGHYCNGFRCVTTSTDPVESPDDMKGLLIRTPENPVIMATMRALGANPQPLAFSELYMALQQGTYDAQENPVPVIYNNKLYEVQKGLSLTNHIYSGMCVAVSDSLWQQMSAEQQEILADAIKETEAFNRETNRNMTEEFLTELEAEGVKIATPDLAPFSAACQSVFDELGSTYGDDLMNRLYDWLENN